MSDSVSIEEMVEAYRNVRETIAKRKEVFEAQMEKLEKSLEVISSAILEFCNEHNLDSVKTPVGTVSRRVQSRYWTNDWESMYNFVVEQNIPFVLEKRIHNGNMQQFLDENPDLMPMGLQLDRKFVIQVRKPSKKGE
jgi:hypothetical protein